MITLITPTGGRPEGFSLCVKYIKEQTYKGPFQWIVVQDTEDILPPIPNGVILKGPKLWEPGINTQRLNLDTALPHIKGDLIFFIEDDDYYSPDYLSTKIELLKYAKAVGEGNCRYYNIKVPGYKELGNMKHSALSQTVVRRELLPLVNSAVNSGEFFIDMVLWKLIHAAKYPYIIHSNSGTTFGMKGLPGRKGLTPSHTGQEKDYFYDSKHSKLKEWLGEKASKLYINL